MARGKHKAMAERRADRLVSETEAALRERIAELENQVREAFRRAADRDALEVAVARLRIHLAAACSDELAAMHEKYGELSAAFAKISWRINTIQSNWDKIGDAYMELVGPGAHGLAVEKLIEELDGISGIVMMHVNPNHTKGLPDKAVAAIELARRKSGLIGWRAAQNIEGQRRRSGKRGKTYQRGYVKPDEPSANADDAS